MPEISISSLTEETSLSKSIPFNDFVFNEEKNILGLKFGKVSADLLTKVALSAVDSLGAKENLEEIKDFLIFQLNVDV